MKSKPISAKELISSTTSIMGLFIAPNRISIRPLMQPWVQQVFAADACRRVFSGTSSRFRASSSRTVFGTQPIESGTLPVENVDQGRHQQPVLAEKPDQAVPVDAPALRLDDRA